MRALRFRDAQVRHRGSGRRIVQWPFLALLLLAAAGSMAHGDVVANALDGRVGTACLTLIVGFALLVAGIRGQVHRG